MKNADKIKGCVYGGALGDAFGYRKNNKEAVEYSDNTERVLFTSRGLTECKDIHFLDSIYESYVDWCDSKNIQSNEKGSIYYSVNENSDYRGLVGVAPVGIYFDTSDKDDDTRVQVGLLGAQTAAITNGHPIGYIPAFGLAYIINDLMYSKDSIKTSVDKLISIIKSDDVDLCNKQYEKEFLELLNKTVDLVNNNNIDSDNIHTISNFGSIENSDIAFAIALYCCLRYEDNCEKAVETAVSYNRENSSTGAIAGNIIGAKVGYNSIPDKYKKSIKSTDLLDKASEELFNSSILN